MFSHDQQDQSSAPDEASVAGVVVHAPEGSPETHRALLRNVGNLIRALPYGTKVEIVAHGPGIALLDKSGPLARDIASLEGATLVACANTMNRLGIDVADLVPEVVVVPAGIAHLVLRQAQGWAYIRP